MIDKKWQNMCCVIMNMTGGLQIKDLVLVEENIINGAGRRRAKTSEVVK